MTDPNPMAIPAPLDAPELVADIQSDISGPQSTLSLALKEKPVITLGLEQNLVHTLSALLASSVSRAEWGLNEYDGNQLASTGTQHPDNAMH